jgi:hypothetical protein
MAKPNPYLALIDAEDEDDKPRRKSQPEAPIEDVVQYRRVPGYDDMGQPSNQDGEKPSSYMDMIEAEMEAGDGYSMEPRLADIGAPAGSAGSALRANAAPVAETLFGAPAGSVVGAAKSAPSSSGGAWLKNWANMERPDFVGGVPEASQAYNRSKGQGKITSRLSKIHGNTPLNIQGFTAQQLAKDADALRLAKEAARTSMAQAALKPVQAVGKVLGGAGVGLGLYDAYTRFHGDDKHGAAVGALGTAASLAPLAMGTAGIAPAIGVAAPLYLMAHDRIEHLKRHPEDVRLQESDYDAMGNRIR